MYFGSIKNCDIANGPGVRVSLFVSGCTHHCPGCFNAETWDFSYGQPFTAETEDQILAWLKPDYISGFSLLGGEPFEVPNQKVLTPFLERIRNTYPNKTIWCYTGYIWESDLLSQSRVRCEYTDTMLSLIDVLVDGEFVESKKNLMLRFRGSENQRLIDLNKSREQGHLVLWEDCGFGNS